MTLDLKKMAQEIISYITSQSSRLLGSYSSETIDDCERKQLHFTLTALQQVADEAALNAHPTLCKAVDVLADREKQQAERIRRLEKELKDLEDCILVEPVHPFSSGVLNFARERIQKARATDG